MVQRTIDGMLACELLTAEQVESKIVSKHLIRVPYSYPVPTLGRDSVLAVIQPWLERTRHLLSGAGSVHGATRSVTPTTR